MKFVVNILKYKVYMFGELVKPIDTLINRSCDGIGGFLKPWQMKRIARAEIEIAQLKAQDELKGQGMLVDAQKLLIYKMIEKEANLHNIKVEAEKCLQTNDSLLNLSEDFISSFVKQVENESDEILQQLWGKVLAGELQHTGSYSKRTLEFIGTLSVDEANNIYKLFNGLVLYNGVPELLSNKYLLTSNSKVIESLPSNNACKHLEELGIFSTLESLNISIYNSDEDDEKPVLMKNFIVTLDEKIAFDLVCKFSWTDDGFKSITVTNTPLTSLGRELAQIARPQPSRKMLKNIARTLDNNNKHIVLRPHRYRKG